MTHLKRIAAPRSWQILRKERMFITRSGPGPHTVACSMPIAVLIKSLGYAQSAREVKKLLTAKHVLVDNRRIKEHHFPVGFMDIIEFEEAGLFYRIGIDKKGRLSITPIKKGDADKKICKIIKKTMLAHARLQLNLSDGRNILIDAAGTTSYKTGDSVIIGLPSQNIIKHLPLGAGSLVIVTGGKHLGDSGAVMEVSGKSVVYTSSAGTTACTIKKNVFVTE